MRTARLTALYETEGPFATVMLDVSRDTENGAHEHELRVRAACEALREKGADEIVVDAISERLSEAVSDPAPVGRMVVATKEGVALDELIHTRVDQPTTSWGVLPDIASWVAYRDSMTTFVLAVVDHEGGDVGPGDALWHLGPPDRHLIGPTRGLVREKGGPDQHPLERAAEERG